MTGSSKALLALAVKGPLEFQTVQLDELWPDEVLVEIKAVGICHADLACLDGKIPVRFPNVFGHEGGGIVIDAGSEVREFTKGDVVLSRYNHCGRFITCKEGHPTYCENMFGLNFSGQRLDGSHTMRTTAGEPLHSNFFGQSAFSQNAVVNSSCVVKVPEKTPLELLCPLGCGLQTGAGAVMNTLNVQPGASILVFGTGTVGMEAIMAAIIRQARIIIGVDINLQRLGIAKTLGATHVLDNVHDLVAQVGRICGGRAVGYAIDATGVPEIVENMINCLGPTGRAVSLGGPPPGAKVKIEVFAHIIASREYIGCNQGNSIAREMIPFLIEQHAQGKFPVEEFVKTYKVDDFDSAIADMRSGRIIKPVLLW